MRWATLLVLTGTYILLYLPGSNTLIVHFATSKFYNIGPWWVSGQTENGSASRLANFDDEFGAAEDGDDADADEAEAKMDKTIKIKIFDNIVPVGWSDYWRKLTSIPTFFQMEFPFCFVYCNFLRFLVWICENYHRPLFSFSSEKLMTKFWRTGGSFNGRR